MFQLATLLRLFCLRFSQSLNILDIVSTLPVFQLLPHVIVCNDLHP